MLERLAREVASLRGRVSRLESIPVPRRYPSLFPFTAYSQPSGITGNRTVFVGTLEPGGTSKVVRWVQAWYVGAPNDATNYWQINLRAESPAVTLATFSTADLGTGTWLRTDLDNLSATVLDTFEILSIRVTKIGSPGALSLANPLVWLE